MEKALIFSRYWTCILELTRVKNHSLVTCAENVLHRKVTLNHIRLFIWECLWAESGFCSWHFHPPFLMTGLFFIVFFNTVASAANRIVGFMCFSLWDFYKEKQRWSYETVLSPFFYHVFVVVLFFFLHVWTICMQFLFLFLESVSSETIKNCHTFCLWDFSLERKKKRPGYETIFIHSCMIWF